DRRHDHLARPAHPREVFQRKIERRIRVAEQDRVRAIRHAGQSRLEMRYAAAARQFAGSRATRVPSAESVHPTTSYPRRRAAESTVSMLARNACRSKA